MTDHRTEIVKRVMRSLEETTDPEELVAAYFDAERDIVVQATQQTLEATGESVSQAVIAERVETELSPSSRRRSPDRDPSLWSRTNTRSSHYSSVTPRGRSPAA